MLLIYLLIHTLFIQYFFSITISLFYTMSISKLCHPLENIRENIREKCNV